MEVVQTFMKSKFQELTELSKGAYCSGGFIKYNPKNGQWEYSDIINKK